MVVPVVRIGEHWEPPHPKPLLITVHALADRIGVKLDRAYGLSYSLGRVYYGPSHTHIRVFTARVEALEALPESGMPLSQAAEAIHQDDDGVYTRPTRQERADIAWGRVRRRRRRRAWQ